MHNRNIVRRGLMVEQLGPNIVRRQQARMQVQVLPSQLAKVNGYAVSIEADAAFVANKICAEAISVQ